jgi:NADH-quinone oxidoreductase subunit G
VSELPSETPHRRARRPLVTESAVGTSPPTPSPTDETVNLTIDGRRVEAGAGQWLIEAADAAGIYIPRFCYHPRLKPVGMCRMCLVEVEGPRGSTLMPACYSPVSDGMVVHTRSEGAVKAQEGVLEFLLVNHPLDCPVCDKGGECPLQDQTLAYGPGETRFVEEKRHWEKPIAISELVMLDRERCIQCGRCVRFADEVAGDPLIDFAERGDQTEVAVFPDQPYSSYFSGNVVQICPVGALTAKPYRFKARPWDLAQVESTCTNCAVGCRTAIQSSAGRLTRLIGVDSDPVNWGWLCDKGRFAYPTSGGPHRLTVPLVRRGDELVEASWGEALAVAAEGLRSARAHEGFSIGVLGGARLANEDAYAWAKLARLVLATDSVDAQLGDGVAAKTILGLPRATIDQAASAPLVITVGPDLKEELPVLYLRLRHAVRENGVRLVELTPAPTGTTPYCVQSAFYRPGELAALAEALTAPGPVSTDVAGVDRRTVEAVRTEIQAAGEKGERDGPAIVVVLGRTSLSESPDQVEAAAGVLAGLPGVAFLPALRRANVHGALDFGLAPGVLPGRVGLEEGRAWFEHHWGGPIPAERGSDAAGILTDGVHGRLGALVLIGADPLADFPDSGLALRGVLGARFVLAVDTHLNESGRRADVVLPAAAWAERRGTFTNLEGRISWLAQLVVESSVSWPDWMIATELAARLGADLGFSRLEDVWEEISRVSPLHRGLSYEVLSGLRARDGVVVPASSADLQAGSAPRPLDPMADPGIASAELHKIAPTALVVTGVDVASEDVPTRSPSGGPGPEGGDAPAPPEGGEVPAEPARLGPPASPPADAGPPAGDGLRLVVRRRMWDSGTHVVDHPELAPLAPGVGVRLHPAVLAETGAAEGEKVQVRSSRGRITAPAVADPSLPSGTVVVDWNQPGGRAGDLIDVAVAVTVVTVEACGGDD